MPVIFSTEEEVEMWINCKKNSPSDAIPVLDQHSKSIASLLEAYQVPILVNSVKNDSPQCIVRLDEWKTKGGIANFFTKKEKKPSIKMEKEEEDLKTNNELMTIIKEEDKDEIPSLDTQVLLSVEELRARTIKEEPESKRRKLDTQ